MAFHHITFDGASLHILAQEVLLLLNGESLPRASLHNDRAVDSGRPARERKMSKPPEGSMEAVKYQKLQRWVEVLESAVRCTSISQIKCTSPSNPAPGSPDPAPKIPILVTPEDSRCPPSRCVDERECSYQYLEAPANTSSAVQTLARSWNISPTLVIATAFAVTLHKYTGDSDIIFGIMSLGRDHQTQNTVGYLASQLPFRVNFSPKSSNPTIEVNMDDLLMQVKRNWGLILDGGVELQDLVPRLPCLQRKTNSCITSPLQVAFSYYKVSKRMLPDAISINGVGVQCKLVVPRSGHTHVDLFCEAQPVKVKGRGTQLTFFWEYRKSALDSVEVGRLQDLMCRLIDAMANNGQIKDINITQRVSDYEANNTPAGDPTPSVASSISAGDPTASVASSISAGDPTASAASSISAGDPTTSVASFPSSSLPKEEHQRLSIAIGPTVIPAASEHLPYIVRFEQKCSDIPKSLAFCSNGEEITYSKACHLVKQLAVILTEKGITLGDHVGLYMSRTPWLYLAILAILKCGAAYVPIALQNPKERISTILQLADSKLLITEKILLQNIPRYHGASLCLEEARKLLEDTDIALFSAPTYHPDQLFYIIFTSGTTGTPKGVAITHANMQSTIANFQSIVSPHECAVTLASINVSFDAHVLDSLAPLLSGASLAVVENIMADIVEGVSYCVTTPSAASVVSFPSSMRAMIVGGEAFTVTCYLNTRHIPKVYNGYGPSECTIFVTAQRICCKEDIASIGRPVSGVKALVLGESRELVPIGEPGTLHVAGATVSPVGYYKNPEKTSKVFFPSPYNSSEILYCTGDQVRMLPDRSLQFLGRSDDQAKLRGMRFQLLEVESILSLHPGVAEAAAVVQEPGTPNAKLLAYVTPVLVSVDSVTQFAAAKLPSFMVPSVITPLAKMPLTKEGKVNRRVLAALPRMLANGGDLEGETAVNVESSKTEAQLARIFAGVIGISGGYPPSADFFASGGHSLQTFQLVNLINQRMGCQLNIAHILQYPTPASLGMIIEKQLLVSVTPPLPGKVTSDSNKTVVQPTALIATSKSTPRQQNEVTTSERDFDWSRMSYLDPVPNVPLSSQLLAQIESFLQRDPVIKANMADEVKAIAEKLLGESGYEVPPNSLLNYPSLRVLQTHLKLMMVLAFTSTAKDPLVQVYPPSSPQELPLFFVHVGIIGWPLPYVKLAKSLGRYGIVVQRSKDAPTSSFREMAAYYVSAVRSVQPHGPYRFIGVCYGTALVYEIAKKLSDEGERVELAALISGSPVNEGRPEVFNEHGQPLPNKPAHPLHFFQSTLQLSIPGDAVTELNTVNAKLEDVSSAVLSAFPWLPFTVLQLQDTFRAYFNSLKSLWFGYTPQPGANIERCLLIHNHEHPFYQSHDYGLLRLLTPSSSLSILVPPRRLGLLSEPETVEYVRTIISLYL